MKVEQRKTFLELLTLKIFTYKEETNLYTFEIELQGRFPKCLPLFFPPTNVE
jgi:hypothetical protein